MKIQINLRASEFFGLRHKTANSGRELMILLFLAMTLYV